MVPYLLHIIFLLQMVGVSQNVMLTGWAFRKMYKAYILMGQHFFEMPNSFFPIYPTIIIGQNKT
jgi:hypothetical protein